MQAHAAKAASQRRGSPAADPEDEQLKKKDKKEKKLLSEKSLERLKAVYGWFVRRPSVITGATPDRPHTFRGSCTLCTEENVQCVWNSKCKLGKLGRVCQDGSDLKDHAADKAHLQAESRQKSKKEGSHAFALMRQHSHVLVKDVVYAMLVITLFMAQHHTPIAQFPAILALLGFLDCPVLKNEVRKLNHSRYFWAGLFALGEVLLHQQLLRINASPFFSIAVDTSTDVATHDHLLMYITYFDPDTFTQFTEFLVCVRVTGKGGKVIFETIMCVLDVLGLNKDKFVAFCSDGDAAMVGRENGVVAFLLKNLRFCLPIHCAGHRCALVASDVAKSPEFKGVFDHADGVLRSSHNMFSKSPKKLSLWQGFVQQKFGLKALKFPSFNATRWFSRVVCVKTLVAQYAMFIVFLKVFALDGALLGNLLDVNTIVLLHYFLDMFTILHRLTIYCQLNNSLPHRLDVHVKQCKDDLSALHNRFVASDSTASPSVSPLFDDRRGNIASGTWRAKIGSKKYLLPGIPFEGFKPNALKKLANQLHTDMITSFDERFPEATASVRQAFAYLDPRSYTGVDIDALPTHMSDNLLTLYTTLSSTVLYGVSWDQLRSEARLVKQTLYALGNARTAHTASGKPTAGGPDECVRLAWVKIRNDHPGRVDNMLRIAGVMFVVMSNTAVVERGFSLHRVYKNRLTNSLKVATLDGLLRIKFLAPESFKDFDFSPAYEIYTTKPHPDRLITKLHKAASDLHVPDFNDDMQFVDEDGAFCVLADDELDALLEMQDEEEEEEVVQPEEAEVDVEVDDEQQMLAEAAAGDDLLVV